MIELGIDRLLREKELQKEWLGQRVAILAHPASVTRDLRHSLDALRSETKLNVVCGFGPQHGLRGEKQDNMIESADFVDFRYQIPIYSLYGEVRRPTEQMLDHFDVILIDLQDVGCRIYTFLTTLFYLLEDCARRDRAVVVLDRPNPAGRPVEGNKLNMKFKSFVGAAPIPMRHGLTLGEAALWYKEVANLQVNLEVVSMKNYDPNRREDWGWPADELAWVNPSPNMPSVLTARQYAGTVLFEGTRISEGRGTTRPLENFGHPEIEAEKVLNRMGELAPAWLKGCVVRPAFFEPTFHKFKGQLVSALQIHVDNPIYRHEEFKPYRLAALFLRTVHELYPKLDLWLPPPYEYEKVHLPIDILSGDETLRKFVTGQVSIEDYDQFLLRDERAWLKEREPFLLY